MTGIINPSSAYEGVILEIPQNGNGRNVWGWVSHRGLLIPTIGFHDVIASEKTMPAFARAARFTDSAGMKHEVNRNCQPAIDRFPPRSFFSLCMTGNTG
jgi:hypothetical protein